MTRAPNTTKMFRLRLVGEIKFFGPLHDLLGVLNVD
jgi:hypothetical protein